jgi:autotransporter-associated beta strand protein
MKCTRYVSPYVAVVILTMSLAPLAFGGTTLGPSIFNATAGTYNWTDATKWDTNPNYPSGVGAVATINNPSTATAALTINVTPSPATEPAVTLGSLTVNNNASGNSAPLTINGGTSTPAHLDAAGAGPVNILVTGSSTGSAVPNTFSWRTIFDDDVSLTVDPTGSTSQAGTLTWSGLVPSGAGGFTKSGDGLLTLSSNAKQYTGATAFNGGRTRISTAGRPTNTSSVTVGAGGQIDPIDAASYTFGASSAVPLNLNGSGPTTGPYAAFPGAIRPDTNLAITINNTVVLQTDSLIHIQGSATGALTLPSGVSGGGKLLLGSIPHDANLGQLILSGTDSYTGGTKVQAGTLVASGSSTTAFGTGNVTVDSANLQFGGSIARIQIQTGATDAIANSATLSLAGGNAAGVADDGYIDLASGINEIVGGLILGGTTFSTAGTYGSSTSGATNPGLSNPDEFFSGSGVINLVPACAPGDLNCDGHVDAGDYVYWRKNGGVPPTDYTTWRAHFGNPPGSGTGGSLSGSMVPEPSACLLASLALGMFVTRRRKNDMGIRR